MKHETMNALVVSTAHMTQEEGRRIDDGEQPAGLATPWAHAEYGWIFWIGTAPNPDEAENAASTTCAYIATAELSEGFRQVIEYAWAHGLEWVRFDRDGDELPGLVTYEW